MPQLVNRLDALKIKRALEPGYYADGAGLYLQVSTGGARSWIFRYTLNGRTRDMGLGSLLTSSLADAREAALEMRKLRAAGIDPIDVRSAQHRLRPMDQVARPIVISGRDESAKRTQL